jgi:N-acetylmuramoyl-L-alanine amidase
MHYAIDAGHNSPPGDTGAVGLAVEDKLNRELADKVIALLVKAGHKVTDCKVPKSDNDFQSLQRRVAIANKSGADLYVSLHFNKFLEQGQLTDKPMGAGIYVASTAGRNVAKKIMPQLNKLGFAIHDGPGGSGIKNSSLYVLVYTDMTAVLLEPFFLDSSADFRVFMEVGMDALAHAIVKGLLA